MSRHSDGHHDGSRYNYAIDPTMNMNTYQQSDNQPVTRDLVPCEEGAKAEDLRNVRSEDVLDVRCSRMSDNRTRIGSQQAYSGVLGALSSAIYSTVAQFTANNHVSAAAPITSSPPNAAPVVIGAYAHESATPAAGNPTTSQNENSRIFNSDTTGNGSVTPFLAAAEQHAMPASGPPAVCRTKITASAHKAGGPQVATGSRVSRVEFTRGIPTGNEPDAFFCSFNDSANRHPAVEFTGGASPTHCSAKSAAALAAPGTIIPGQSPPLTERADVNQNAFHDVATVIVESCSTQAATAISRVAIPARSASCPTKAASAAHAAAGTHTPAQELPSPAAPASPPTTKTHSGNANDILRARLTGTSIPLPRRESPPPVTHAAEAAFPAPPAPPPTTKTHSGNAFDVLRARLRGISIPPPRRDTPPPSTHVAEAAFRAVKVTSTGQIIYSRGVNGNEGSSMIAPGGSANAALAAKGDNPIVGREVCTTIRSKQRRYNYSQSQQQLQQRSQQLHPTSVLSVPSTDLNDLSSQSQRSSTGGNEMRRFVNVGTSMGKVVDTQRSRILPAPNGAPPQMAVGTAGGTQSVHSLTSSSVNSGAPGAPTAAAAPSFRYIYKDGYDIYGFRDPQQTPKRQALLRLAKANVQRVKKEAEFFRADRALRHEQMQHFQTAGWCYHAYWGVKNAERNAAGPASREREARAAHDGAQVDKFDAEAEIRDAEGYYRLAQNKLHDATSRFFARVEAKEKAERALRKLDGLEMEEEPLFFQDEEGGDLDWIHLEHNDEEEDEIWRQLFDNVHFAEGPLDDSSRKRSRGSESVPDHDNAEDTRGDDDTCLLHRRPAKSVLSEEQAAEAIAKGLEAEQTIQDTKAKHSTTAMAEVAHGKQEESQPTEESERLVLERSLDDAIAMLAKSDEEVNELSMTAGNARAAVEKAREQPAVVAAAVELLRIENFKEQAEKNVQQAQEWIEFVRYTRTNARVWEKQARENVARATAAAMVARREYEASWFTASNAWAAVAALPAEVLDGFVVTPHNLFKILVEESYYVGDNEL